MNWQELRSKWIERLETPRENYMYRVRSFLMKPECASEEYFREAVEEMEEIIPTLHGELKYSRISVFVNDTNLLLLIRTMLNDPSEENLKFLNEFPS